MAIVYQATNLINGKRYIGVTGRGLQRRRNEHLSRAERNLEDGRLSRAIRKYGRDSFRFSVLMECETDDLVWHEIRLIALLKPEYNATTGGDGSPGHKVGKKVRDTNRRIHAGNRYRLGKTHSVETRKRLKEAATQRYPLFQTFQHLGPKAISRRVECVETGEVFDSATAAARAHGVAKSALIELCLGKRYRHTVGGKVYRYIDAAS